MKMGQKASNNMVGIISLAVVVATIVCLSAMPVRGQFEVCHWECILIGCDYYGDCDYDCYEICDFWRDQHTQQFPSASWESDSSSKAAPNTEGKRGIMMRLKAQNSTGNVDTSSRVALWDQCRQLDTTTDKAPTTKPQTETKKLQASKLVSSFSRLLEARRV